MRNIGGDDPKLLGDIYPPSPPQDLRPCVYAAYMGCRYGRNILTCPEFEFLARNIVRVPVSFLAKSVFIDALSANLART